MYFVPAMIRPPSPALKLFVYDMSIRIGMKYNQKDITTSDKVIATFSA